MVDCNSPDPGTVTGGIWNSNAWLGKRLRGELLRIGTSNKDDPVALGSLATDSELIGEGFVCLAATTMVG